MTVCLASLIFAKNQALYAYTIKNILRCKLSRVFDGGGATRPLPRDGGVEELHGDPTVGPRKDSNAGQSRKK